VERESIFEKQQIAASVKTPQPRAAAAIAEIAVIAA
jgi:hypothetical protein